MAGEMGRIQAPGIQRIIERLEADGPAISAAALVDGCLDMLGGYELTPETRAMLVDHAESEGDTVDNFADFGQRVGQMLQLIVSTQEYQFT